MKFARLLKKLHGGAPLLAVLVDPEKFHPAVIEKASGTPTACFLVGGSTVAKGRTAKVVRAIKRESALPVVLFPGDESQLTGLADGLLLISLLSGRNPEYLIGKHVRAARTIRRLQLPHLSTAYLLIDGGGRSTTQRVTRTKPLQRSDVRLVIDTAIAAEQLGFSAIYLEGGSGARRSVPASLVRKVRKEVSLPLIVGGGIASVSQAAALARAGANMVVVGNAIERRPALLTEIAAAF